VASPLDQAQALLELGFSPIPVPYGSKAPVLRDWPNLRLTPETLGDYFNGERQNIGSLCGAPSCNQHAADLDCTESNVLADHFLPLTDRVHGRPTWPRSKRWYIPSVPIATVQYHDPLHPREQGMLVELLGQGRQVIMPNSTHPSGERYTWATCGEPAVVEAEDLTRAVRWLAAASLLVRYWPVVGSRHKAALALAGGLLRAGWTKGTVTTFIEAVCEAARDDETRSRLRDVASTAARIEEDGATTGWPTLAQFLGAPVVDRVQEWLGVKSSVVTIARQEIPEVPWPQPLAEEAFHGLAGEIVRAIEPYSEADPAALLAHMHIGVGALVGPHVHAIAGDAPHSARLNAVLVGETAKGRKGSAARPVERLLQQVDAAFVPGCVVEGLSSGEGLVWQVRDAIERPERTGRGADRRTELVEVDPGVEDKRLLVVESEFASTLRVIQREGSTLSAVVRRAWDSGDLRTLTKNSPAVATGAHICIIGHVTRDELLRYLDRTELASGFANRFLWFAVRRGRLLPDGERVADAAFAPLVRRLRAVYDWARTPRVLKRDVDASRIWHRIYEQLSEGRPGLYGAATNRAEAQVLRLSVQYAILDMAEEIRADHLLAALAVWRYADQSARWIFRDSTGDPTADTILAALRCGGALDRTAISALFGRNFSRERIDHALGILLRAGLARMETVTGTRGRDREVWHAT
jgi:hypothetical protein